MITSANGVGFSRHEISSTLRRRSNVPDRLCHGRRSKTCALIDIFCSYDRACVLDQGPEAFLEGDLYGALEDQRFLRTYCVHEHDDDFQRLCEVSAKHLAVFLEDDLPSFIDTFMTGSQPNDWSQQLTKHVLSTTHADAHSADKFLAQKLMKRAVNTDYCYEPDSAGPETEWIWSVPERQAVISQLIQEERERQRFETFIVRTFLYLANADMWRLRSSRTALGLH